MLLAYSDDDDVCIKFVTNLRINSVNINLFLLIDVDQCAIIPFITLNSAVNCGLNFYAPYIIKLHQALYILGDGQ